MASKSKQRKVSRNTGESFTTACAVAATGTQMRTLQNTRLDQVEQVLSPGRSPEGHNAALVGALQTMIEISPRNGLEAMLAIQMVATNDAALECFKRAAFARMHPDTDDRDMRHALKLLGLFNRQVEVLTKLRQSELFENHGGLTGSQVPPPPPETEEELEEKRRKLSEAIAKAFAKQLDKKEWQESKNDDKSRGT